MRAVLLALASACWSGAVGAQVFDPARFLPLAGTVMRVEAPTASGQLKVGTAITVAPGVAVTNCHVIRDAVSVRVTRRSGRWPVEGQFADAEHDLCFLSVPTWPGRPVRFAEPGSLRLYQPVVAMGYTRGAGVSLTPGEITGLHGHDGGRIIQTTSSFTSGASGGALLDTEGRLMGVLTFRLRGNIDHYFSVPASWVSARLPIHADQFGPVGSVAGVAFWEAEGCCVPYFMRVSALQSQEKWPELLHLADEWVAADPSDADAWYMRGVAQARLRQPGDAAVALERTVGLAPRMAAAWLELGAAGLETGDAEVVARAVDALAALGSVLEQRLRDMMPPRLADPVQEHQCNGCANSAR